MKRRCLPLLANLFVAGYTLDASFSLLEEGLRALTGSTLLLGPRNALAALVMYAAVLCLPALVITPRLPVSVFLPLVLSALWLNLGAAPLPLVIESGSGLGLAAASLQVAVAAVALLWIRRRNGGRSWLFTADSLTGPALSLRHSLGFAVATVFLLVPASVVYILVFLATWVQLGTQGFVSFDLVGVSLEARRYVRADREIRLVGMMHIGEEEAYRELVSSFVTESTVVLAEGISDERAILEVPLSYERAARALGLEQQDDLYRYLAESADDEFPDWPVVRHADLDMSDFAPETIEWLAWVAGVWDSNRPVAALMKLLSRFSEGDNEWAIVERDIFQRRNEHLLAEVEAALEDYERVVVPWGGLHLPFIEGAILERGFDPTDRDRRRLISWLTIGTALL
jgi:hypothetical protein